MSNIVPQTFNPLNHPIEVATSFSTGDSTMRLQVGTSTDTERYFSGIIYRRPNTSFIGADVQQYVKHLPNPILGADLTNPEFEIYNLTEFCKTLTIRIRRTNNALLLNSNNISVTAQNLNHYELSKYRVNEPFGVYEYYRETGTAPVTFKTAAFKDDWVVNNYWSFERNFVDSTGINFTTKYHRENTIPRLKNSPVFLTLFNQGTSSIEFDVRFRYYNAAGTVVTSTAPINILIQPRSAYLFTGLNLFPEDSHLWTNSAFTIENNDLLFSTISPAYRIARFKELDACEVSNNRQDAYQLYWLNRRGGIDHYPMSGRAEKIQNVSRDKYSIKRRELTNAGFIGGLEKQINLPYNTETLNEYRLNTSYVNDWQSRLYFDSLNESPYVWLWSDKDQKLYAVDVVGSQYNYKNFRNDGLINFSVVVRDQHLNYR